MIVEAGSSSSRCSGAVFLFLLFALRAGEAVLTPEQRSRFLCDHPCTPFVTKAQEFDPTNSILVFTNQDQDAAATLTQVLVRTPCVDFSNALDVLSETNLALSLNISADKLIIGQAAATPFLANARIFANEAEIGGGSLLETIDLFQLLGYPQVIAPLTGPAPVIWKWFTLDPEPPIAKNIFNFGRITNLASGPLRVLKEVRLPRLLKVRGVAIDGSPASSVLYGRTEAEIFNGSPTSPVPLCSDIIFRSLSGKLPSGCYRNARQEGRSWKYTVYLFAWDVDYMGVPGDDPSRVKPLTSTTQDFVDLFVADESSRSALLPIKNDYDNLDAEQRLPERPGDRLPDPADRMVFLKYAIDSPTRDPDSSNQTPTYWNFVGIFYASMDLAYDLIISNHPIPFTPSPGLSPDPDALWLLTTCWRNLYKFPPYIAPFTSNLLSQINFLQSPNNTLRDDHALTVSVKLYNEVNTEYLPQQREVTKLSLDIYMRTLYNWATTYQLLKLQVFNALNFNKAQQDRRAAAQTALEYTYSAESDAFTVYVRLRDRASDQLEAVKQLRAVYDQKEALLPGLAETFQAGIREYAGAQAADAVFGILNGLAGVWGGLKKKEDWNVARGIVDAGRGDANLVLVFLSYEKLVDTFSKFEQVYDVVTNVGDSRTGAEFVIEKIESAIDRDDPKLFTEDDRLALAGGILRIDLSTLKQGLLNYEDLITTSPELFGSALNNAIRGASDYVVAIKEYCNTGTFLLNNIINLLDTYTQQIVAGVDYVNAKANRIASSSALKDIQADPYKLKSLNLNLMVTSISVLNSVLITLNNACDAYSFAYVRDCPVDPDVLNGRREDKLTSTINMLMEKFADIPALQPFDASLTYSGADLDGLRQNNTFTIDVTLDNFKVADLYAVNVDEISLAFKGLRWQPEDAQVLLQMASSGFQVNRNEHSRIFTFRGPSTIRGFVFQPSTGEILIPGRVYPGDEFKYFKPSIFTLWQFTVYAEPFNYGTVCSDSSNPLVCPYINVTEVDEVTVSFKGRAGVIFLPGGEGGEDGFCPDCNLCTNCTASCPVCAPPPNRLELSCCNGPCSGHESDGRQVETELNTHGKGQRQIYSRYGKKHTSQVQRCKRLIGSILDTKQKLCRLYDNFCTSRLI